jgi:hypothetical protein
MEDRKDILAEAITRLKQEGLGTGAPPEVTDETIRRLRELAEASAGPPAHRHRVPLGFKVAAAAAALILMGYAVGRLSAPQPPDLEQLRRALTPSVAADIEPALRERLIGEMQQRYQLALAGTYVRVKEELTEQYRNDLNRFAVQTLAASNAATNDLLTQLVQAMDTAKAQDLRRIAQVLYQIESNRMQDRTQLASGLQTLAYRTENELTRTRQEVAQLLGDVRPEGPEFPSAQPKRIPEERNEP